MADARKEHPVNIYVRLLLCQTYTFWNISIYSLESETIVVRQKDYLVLKYSHTRMIKSTKDWKITGI